MTRLVMISALSSLGLAMVGAPPASQEPSSAGSSTATKGAVHEPVPARPAIPPKPIERITVRVVDVQERDVPNIEVEVIDHRSPSDGRRYRTGPDGRFRFPVDPRFRRIEFQAHPDDRTLGWARITNGIRSPQGTDKDPVTLMLLPLNHRVEGSVVDARGKPIRGVQIRPYQIEHQTMNGFWTGSFLGPVVTDEAGRFAITLPADTHVSRFRAYHPRYAGPWFHCGPGDRSIPPVTLSDAGGIAGTVADSTTGKPVEGALVGARNLEHGAGGPLGGGWGDATSDPQGHFQIGGLAPGVYHLSFEASPLGRRFLAHDVEGVRVRAGQDARADLLMFEGRRLHGTAIDLLDNTPMAGTLVSCSSPPHLRSGPAHQGTYTDEQGRFEFFVPPGPAVVSIPTDEKSLTVPSDRDPEPVRLENKPDATARPIRPIEVVNCSVRVRVKTDEGNVPAEAEARNLTGRIFDAEGSPIPGVRVYYTAPQQIMGIAATDRLGLFRLTGLPKGQLRLSVNKANFGSGRAVIPPDAWEVDLTLPHRTDPPE